jgi:predicted phage terminase large subunit-like protein
VWSLTAETDEPQDAPTTIALTDFKRNLYRRYKHTAHLETLDYHLTQVTRYIETQGAEGIGHLIIEMPPRHGKTITTSRLYPIWHLGRNPDHRLMLVSYGQKLADKNSRAARNMIKSPLYTALYPNVRLAPDSQDVSSWNLDGYEGGADAIGIDAGATGKGAHLLIIDDPIKNRAEAESETYREKVWDGYADDLYSRLEPYGAVIIMMTRWHMDDLIGRLLLNEPDKWTRLRLPAIAEKNDPLGRAEGAPLWEERYPLSRLEEIKRTQGEYSFSALYQQSPVVSSAGVFDTTKIKIVDIAPHCIREVRYYDLAVSEKATSDYTAGVRMGITENGEPVILHMYRKQANPAGTGAAIVQNAMLDGANIAIKLEAENSARVQLDYLLREPALYGYNLMLQPINGDKFTRALPFAARVNAGMAYMVRGDWNTDFVDELSSFNQGRYDDQVDACSGGWFYLNAPPENAPLSYTTSDQIPDDWRRG